VNSPGVYELKGRMTVVDAVAMAGGLSERGQMDSIILIRKSQDGTFAGTRIDLEEILFSQQGDNTYLMPADIVHVPMTFIGKVDVFVDQYFNKISGFWYSYIAAREVTNPEGRFIFGR
jgi:protein involved in polysaccharide export with SLBB domain